MDLVETEEAFPVRSLPVRAISSFPTDQRTSNHRESSTGTDAANVLELNN